MIRGSLIVTAFSTRVSTSLAAVAVLGICGCAAGTASNGTGDSKLVAVSITAQPANQSVSVGQAATFTVSASGSAPIAYQWQKNAANIVGATAASYTTPPAAAADSGTMFNVVVSNTMGSVTSNAATLTVNSSNAAPTITTQPVNQTVAAGQTATF